MSDAKEQAGGTAESSGEEQPTKQKRITKEAKVACWELLSKKQWSKLDEKDAELVALMKKYNLDVSQIKRQYANWDKTRGVNTLEKRSQEDLVASLEERSHSAQAIFDRAAKDEEMVFLLECAGPNESRCKEILRFESSVIDWELFRRRVLELIAMYRAKVLTEISSFSRNYTAEELKVVGTHSSLFEADSQQVRDFVYLYLTSFIRYLLRSIKDPDNAEADQQIINDIIRKRPKIERNAYAATLYYLCGAIVKSVQSEGKRRGKNGATFYKFAETNTLAPKEVDRLRKNNNSLMEKVDRVSRGQLIYSHFSFYKTMETIEQIYCRLLTTENLIWYGPQAIQRIENLVAGNGSLRRLIAARVLDVHSEEGRILVDFVLNLWTNIRGKDFVHKLLGRSKASVTVATRRYMKAVSNPKAHASAKESGVCTEELDDCTEEPDGEEPDGEELDDEESLCLTEDEFWNSDEIQNGLAKIDAFVDEQERLGMVRDGETETDMCNGSSDENGLLDESLIGKIVNDLTQATDD